MSLQLLQERAKNAKECLDWLDVCNAACCKMFVLQIPKWQDPRALFKGKQITWETEDMNYEDKHYLELHGVTIQDNAISFRLQDFKIQGQKLYVYMTCRWLTDNKCSHYDQPDRPLICGSYTQATWTENKYYAPKNCLYRVKGEMEE